MLPDGYVLKRFYFQILVQLIKDMQIQHTLWYKKASVDLNVATVAFVAFFVICITNCSVGESIKYCSSSITIYCQIYWETHAFPFLQLLNQLVKMLHRRVVLQYFLAVHTGGFYLNSVLTLLRFIFDVSFCGVFAKILFPLDMM